MSHSDSVMVGEQLKISDSVLELGVDFCEVVGFKLKVGTFKYFLLSKLESELKF